MEFLAALLIALGFLATQYPLKAVPEDEVVVYPDIPGIHLAQRYEVKPASVFKDENIVKQQFDYSCGSAALATLLNYYLGEELTEQQVIRGLMEYGDANLISQRRAFSLMDMKKFVTVLGYQGAGYTADLEDLKKLNGPCIIPIEFSGYKHFVVYRGIYSDHIYFADPFMGNISFTIKEFQGMWHKNIVFIVSSERKTLDALLLKEKDLLIAEYDMAGDILLEPVRPTFLREEQRFKESIGRTDEGAAMRTQFRTIGVP